MPLREIAFHVTDRCQLDCAHCLRDPAQQPTDLPVELIARVLAEAVSTYRVGHVALTGGEPALHPRFAEILDVVWARGCTFHFLSNGRRLDRVLAMLAEEPRRRAALHMIELSLDGADEATHDHIRGEGSFREVMGAVSQCVAHGVPFALQITLHARNVHQIEQMGLLAAGLGASGLSIAMMQPTGTHHDGPLFLSAAEWTRARDRIDSLAATLKMPVLVPEGFPRKEAFHTCAPFRSELLHVDVHGRLNLCCQHSDVPSHGRTDDIAGDLATTSLLDAHERLLDIVHRAQRERLAQLRAGSDSPWSAFPCNSCLQMFGKPHWTDTGTAGAKAVRARWRLPVLGDAA